jgi:hypothetical protein
MEPLFHAESKAVDKVLNLIDRAMELHEKS